MCYNVMPCSYPYLQLNFYNVFDGAVSITVVLKEYENKVEGSSPKLRVRDLVKLFFLLSQRCRKVSCFTYLQKKACFDVLSTTSLSKMARLVWRYSDDAGAIIENVYKFCMEEKKSGMKLSVYGSGLQYSLALADLPLRKLWKRKRRHRTNSNNQSNVESVPG